MNSSIVKDIAPRSALKCNMFKRNVDFQGTTQRCTPEDGTLPALRCLHTSGSQTIWGLRPLINGLHGPLREVIHYNKMRHQVNNFTVGKFLIWWWAWWSDTSFPAPGLKILQS
jgi:hypothetical protein